MTNDECVGTLAEKSLTLSESDWVNSEVYSYLK